MKQKPVLGEWEIPHIESIRTAEQRLLVELPIPGRVGSLYQDLNSRPTEIVIAGSLFGDEARDDFLNQVREKYKKGDPVTFVADITTATDVQYVVIEALEMRESGRAPDEMSYRIVLRESPPPPPPPAFPDIDTSLLDQAGNLLDTVTGALDAIEALGSIPNFGNPTEPLKGALDGVTSAASGLGAALDPLHAIFGKGD